MVDGGMLDFVAIPPQNEELWFVSLLLHCQKYPPSHRKLYYKRGEKKKKKTNSSSLDRPHWAPTIFTRASKINQRIIKKRTTGGFLFDQVIGEATRIPMSTDP